MLKLHWTIERHGDVKPTTAQVKINTIEEPDEVRLRTEWQDCEAKAHWRQRRVRVALEALVQWDESGTITKDEAAGFLEERFGTSESAEVQTRQVIIKDNGLKGAKAYVLHDGTKEKFRGAVGRETPDGASILVTGKVRVQSQSATGTKDKGDVTFRSEALGNFHARVSSLALVDQSEGIVVPGE